MNISEVITSIKTEIGLWDIVLPIKDGQGNPVPIETSIQSILEKVTVPRYSQYVPWNRSGDCSLRNLKVIDEPNGIYMLPAGLTTTEVMYVIDIQPVMTRNTRGYLNGNLLVPGCSVGAVSQTIINTTATSMMSGLMSRKPTFEWLKYNKVALYNFPDGLLHFEVACKHLPNLESIEESCYDSFMQLALLDVKMFVWNILKRYKNIPSAYGNLNLEIDDLQSATEDKRTLLADWDDRFHLDLPIWKYI